MKLEVLKVEDKKKKKIPPFDQSLGFGTSFADHMFIMHYSEGHWHDAKIEPFRSFLMDPAAMVFHYGQGVFEGLKAYRSNENIYLFRPQENIKRMNNSLKRIVMPTINESFVLDTIKTLVLLDKQWIPPHRGYSLYIRPCMIATEPCLGIRAANSYCFFVITSPVGSYYAKGFNPIDIYVTEKYVRAVPGGVGAAKVIGNYATSLLAMEDGVKHGCSQVLWLDGKEHKYIEEVGAMNVFIRFKNSLATPNLTGSILPGIVRDSVITIAKAWGINVLEKQISIEEVIEGIESGEVIEVFGTGTAAVISPVGSLVYKNKKHIVSDGKVGSLSQKMLDFITSLQLGMQNDEFGFVSKIL